MSSEEELIKAQDASKIHEQTILQITKDLETICSVSNDIEETQFSEEHKNKLKQIFISGKSIVF